MEDVTLEVLYDRVLVKRDPAREEVGGIAIPDEARSPTCLGTIVAVGCGRRTSDGTLTPLLVKVGQRVVFGIGALTLPDDLGVGSDLVVLREDEVVGIVREALGHA